MEDQTKPGIDFHYIKDKNFSTVYSSGIYGGLTPNGLIDINFFLERGPIPQKVSYQIDNVDGHAREVGKETKNGWVREVKIGILIDSSTATALIGWLNARIAEIETRELSTAKTIIENV